MNDLAGIMGLTGIYVTYGDQTNQGGTSGLLGNLGEKVKVGIPGRCTVAWVPDVTYNIAGKRSGSSLAIRPPYTRRPSRAVFAR